MTIKRSSISFRICASLWLDEGFFGDLLDLFDRFDGIKDDIVLFTSDTHAPLSLESMRERAPIIADRLAKIRERGYGAGVNILTTIGHHEENFSGSLTGGFTRMTNIQGEVSRAVLCPNDERSRDYIRQLYEIIASCKPDYIWIDDDVRFGHMPIGNGCFCDNCLGIFESESGTRFTRESLRDAFNNGRTDIRKLWIEHNRNTINRLFELIEKTVHTIEPRMPLGFMTGDRFFEGYDFDRWAKTLAGPANTPVFWRPGGGFYADNCMSELAGKSHDIGRQVSLLPPWVECIQSEIENFPYQALKKSAHATALEAASHIAAGCTGTAFNVLTANAKPGTNANLHQYEPILERIAESRPFYDLLAQTFCRSAPEGIYTGWNKNSIITGEGDWLNCDHPGTSGSHASELLELGLPAAYCLDHAQITALTRESALAMDDQTIIKILSSGVYMDAKALECLNKLGYGQFTGFDVDGYIDHDGIEELIDHPVNGGLAGSRRDCRQSFLFWLQPAANLVPRDDACATLSHLNDYSGKELSDCCMGIYENSLGGRVCIAGYYPWTFVQEYSKSTQIKSLMRWLSCGKLAAYIGSYHKINLWARRTQDGRQAVAFTNSSHDSTDDLTIMLRTDKDMLSVFDMACDETIVTAKNTFSDYKEFVLPTVEPWHMGLLVE